MSAFRSNNKQNNWKSPFWMYLLFQFNLFVAPGFLCVILLIYNLELPFNYCCILHWSYFITSFDQWRFSFSLYLIVCAYCCICICISAFASHIALIRFDLIAWFGHWRFSFTSLSSSLIYDASAWNCDAIKHPNQITKDAFICQDPQMYLWSFVFRVLSNSSH